MKDLVYKILVWKVLIHFIEGIAGVGEEEESFKQWQKVPVTCTSYSSKYNSSYFPCEPSYVRGWRGVTWANSRVRSESVGVEPQVSVSESRASIINFYGLKMGEISMAGKMCG